MKFKFLANNLRNKSFDFVPMYYDERKERLDLKKKEIERIQNKDISDEDRESILRQNMKESWSRTKNAQQSRTTSNYRVILLVLVILVLGYFIFNGLDDVDKVVKKLW